MSEAAPSGTTAPGPPAARLIRRLLPRRRHLVPVVALAVAGVAPAVVGPAILGRATDIIFSGLVGRTLPAGTPLDQVVAQVRADGNGNLADLLARMNPVPGAGIDFGRLGPVLLLALALFAGAAALNMAQALLLNGMVHRTVGRLRADVEAKINRLPLPYFDDQPRGELLSRVSNDIDNIAQSLQQTLSQMLTAVLTVIGVLTMMFVVSPLLAFVSLVTVPLSVVLAKRIATRAQPRFAAQWASVGAVNALIEEAITGHELVKVFGRRREVQAAFAAKNDELFRASSDAQVMSGVIVPSMMFIGNLGYVAIAVAGALRVASGAMTLGDVQAFIQYTGQFTSPLSQVASMANLLQSCVASAARVFALLDAPDQSPDPPAPVPLGPVRGRVEFHGVSFRYRPDKPLLTDLSLVAEPGRTVAIVGPTGAGKTTLVNLLMRFYEVESGRVTLDGIDISTLRRDTLRGRIGMVLQDTWLFGGTIWDNIAYGRPEATGEQILAAAEAAFVDRFAHGLPQGYDTVVDGEGGTISSGERQLVTIARAFLADPAVLILDEATSSVDTRTEVLVRKAMASLRAGRTSFVIAHRLSTIVDADLIVVMEDGRIVEQGDHTRLIAARGAYHRLYEAQFRKAAEDSGVPGDAGPPDRGGPAPRAVRT
ncbi:multidrug ABC transporter ATP-binding protein [Sphaerisporangium krabiense]|uniref:Fatty acid ABC transporter ATP-binding/permease protein n=1 Tax=Sphaerisporangium krabiense TaxID=763782 RepID=A0A7W9DQH8_9ACTN|nr:ABC transporter ATP-binding protein [Sphaerisporangium krabiense]MBB5627501.1 ATP-binding cassette subfamily B protein [Sphaerisporangium krabiense]GII64360.1 multidrug ABC transporter ATP-binding protein [Sphaerisporangium krabiense]